MMSSNSKKKLPPETLLYTGNINRPTKISHVQYNDTQLNKYDKIQPLKENFVDWIVVEGLQDIKQINDLLNEYLVDPLIVEDIFNVNQRNKIEIYDSYAFAVQRYNYISEGKILYDYISILMFKDKLVTFSEENNFFVNDVYKRLETKSSIIRHQKINYLFYVLIDMIVDEKYDVFFQLEKDINLLEANLLDLDRKDELKLYKIRKELLFLRNSSTQLLDSIFLTKEVIKVLSDSSSKKYYLDLKDHLMNLESKTKFEIDVINNVYEMHLNNLSHRMNNIMTTLTIFSAIFIPLSFIAGVFGMNFINFPILQNPNGMLYFILICVIIPVIMLCYFKIKKWF